MWAPQPECSRSRARHRPPRRSRWCDRARASAVSCSPAWAWSARNRPAPAARSPSAPFRRARAPSLIVWAEATCWMQPVSSPPGRGARPSPASPRPGARGPRRTAGPAAAAPRAERLGRYRSSRRHAQPRRPAGLIEPEPRGGQAEERRVGQQQGEVDPAEAPAQEPARPLPLDLGARGPMSWPLRHTGRADVSQARAAQAEDRGARPWSRSG